MTQLRGKLKRTLVVLSLSIVFCLTGYADEVLLKPSEDTFILGDFPGWAYHNWGKFSEICIGLNEPNAPYRTLMRFDLASLGASHSITSATLRLVTTRVHKLQQEHGNFKVNLFLLDDSNSQWSEGSKVDTRASNGDPCWRYRELDTGEWAGGPGIGRSTASPGIAALLDTLEVDVTNTVSGTAYEFTIDSPAGISALAAWAAGSDNAGLLLTSDEGAVTNAQNVIYFASKEYESAGSRPQLTVHTEGGDFMFGASDDTFIWNAHFLYHSGINYGAFATLYAGVNASAHSYRSLLRFDVASVLRSRYLTIDGASLTLTVTSTEKIHKDRGNFELYLFAIDESNKEWHSGSKSAKQATAGESCWSYLAFDTIPWAGGQGIGNHSGSPGISHLLGTVTIEVDTIEADQKIVFDLSSSEAMELINQWASGGVNAGFLLATDEASGGQNAIELAASEYADSLAHPVLAIEYTTDEYAFTASEDNFMYSTSVHGNRNWGKWSTPFLVIGMNNTTDRFRTLVRFGLSELGIQGKQVKCATLTLTQANNDKIKPVNGAFFDVRLLLLADENAAWIEGTGGDTPAKTGESCWNYQQYNNVAWVGGAGIGNSIESEGVAAQLATTRIDTTTIKVGDSVTFHIESPEGLEALERWARSGINAGFLLATDESPVGQNALNVGSREHGTVEWRPTLRVVLERKIPTGTMVILK